MANTRGRLSIDCVYAHANCLYPIGNSNVPGSSAVTMETNIEKSGFHEIAGIFR